MARFSLPVTRRRSIAATVVRAGFAAGILDIAATGLKVVVFGQTTTVRLFQSIAAGLLGPDAFKGGLPVAALGVALHFGIATIWAAIFTIAAIRISRLGRIQSIAGVIALGMAYGAVVWLVMDFVVLALSHARPLPVATPAFWIQLAIHMGCVGLPIALIVLGRR